MKMKHLSIVAISAALIAAAFVPAFGADESVVVANADLKWVNLGDSGVSAALVSGDMEKGASRFFLKYPAGFVTPLHHHTTDHYITLVSGSITLTVDGKDYKLGPGSYFELKQKKPHAAKVEGSEAAVFFIEAEKAWDVVLEKK